MIKITKMELLKLKQDKQLLVKSLELLKNKRDSLINKIINSIMKSKKDYEIYSSIQDELTSVFKKLFIKYNSIFLDIESINQPSFFNVNKEDVHFLNLSWPVLTPSIDLSFFDENFKIIKEEDLTLLKDSMTKFVNNLCSFGSLVSNISVYLLEVRKLTRRVNFLKKTRLPKYDKEINKLKQALDEKEREEIIRLKKVKESIINQKEF